MKMQKKTWRLIIDGPADAVTNMAVDEAILKENEVPTIRIYQWHPPAVSIGYFQSLIREVDIKRCRDAGVSTIRRITGGGAVYHDWELTYSLICPEKLVPKDIIKSYELICGAVVDALNNLGINAEFCPINDITVDGKKISGSAQTRKNGVVLQHGTILLETDVDRMFSLLLVPDEKIKDKVISSVKERITSMSKFGYGSEDIGKITKTLIASFENKLKIRLIQGRLSKKEEQRKEKSTKRLSSDEWNYMR